MRCGIENATAALITASDDLAETNKVLLARARTEQELASIRRLQDVAQAIRRARQHLAAIHPNRREP
jgi:hypothetical protein